MSCCIIIAGVPASGKTTFADSLSKTLGLPMISKDRLKELMYESVGFSCRAEKVKLSTAATNIMYYYAETMMGAGLPFILENNFENVVKPRLQHLLETYAYHPVTVRFGGDIRVIYERYVMRERSPQRHGGHKTNAAWPPQPGTLSAPMTMDEFVAGVTERGIIDFSVGGEEILVDATDFARVSYEDIIQQVRHWLSIYGPPPPV